MIGINESNSVAQVFISITNNLTGSLFLTFLIIFMLIMAFFIAFRVPPFLSLSLVLPLAIVFMAFDGMFLAIGGALLIYLGFMFAMNYFLYR